MSRGTLRLLLGLALLATLALPSFSGLFEAMGGGDPVRQKITALREENEVLETELGLASQGMTYIIMELGLGSHPQPVKISLKNRGMALREFQAERLRYRRARLLLTKPHPLLKKATFFPVRRKEIKPHRPEEDVKGPGEMEFLEAKDMPSTYILKFSGGLSISVVSHPEGLISRFFYPIRCLWIHLRHSFMIVWNHLWGNEFAIIELMMEREEARCFYWSLEEGMRMVVREGINDGTL